MVFGYYHITMRTAEKDFAQRLGCPPNGTISQKVKVGHVMWIPFIPLGTVWMMEAAGNSYGLSGQAESSLNFKYGNKSAPWYSYLGLILIIVGPMIFSGMSSMKSKQRTKRYTAQHEEKVAKRLAAIDNVANTDYYYFKSSDYKNVVLRAEESIGDSIRFEAPLDNDTKKWKIKNWAVGYYAGKPKTQFVNIAKSDLKNSFQKEYPNRGTMRRFTVPALPFMKDMGIDKIIHMKGVSMESVPVVDEKAEANVKEALQHFMEHMSKGDSLMHLMSDKSKQYYKDMLTNATGTDKEARKYTFSSRSGTGFSTGAYETMLYTKYVYLKTGTEKEKDIQEDFKDLSSYIFFLRLMDRSFLNISNEAFKNAEITNITIPSQTKATASLSAMSNILKVPKAVKFSVTLDKEDGEWKVNVPSSYSYTDAQVIGTNYQNIGSTTNQFKEMIRGNVEKLMDGPLPANWK